jgi:hypothetical protein
MAYRHEFDYTPVLFFRGDYSLARKALDLLRSEVQTWNEKALSHGALSVPYDNEIRDLDFIIEQFAGVEDSRDLTGLAVGTLRYVKAGLVLLAARKEGEISDKVKEGWPDAVVESMREGLRQVNFLASALEVEPAGILNEIAVGLGRKRSVDALDWDVFISHASEDKEEFARPLAERLRSEGLRVWYDYFVLKVGESLNRSIDAGLARSKFGVVIVSPSFLAKEWPQRELDGLVTREVDGTRVILPIWHNLQYEQLRARSPLLADRIAAKSSEGLDQVVARLLEAIRPSSA